MTKKRKLEKLFEGCESGTEKSPENIEEVNPSDIDKDLAALKSATLPEEIGLAKNKLKSTLSFRSEQIKQKDFQLCENCQYFFVCPQLILYDFTLRYERCDKFMSVEWQKYQSHIFTVVKNSGKSILYTEPEKEQDWDSCTLSVLNLIRLLPPSPAGRKKLSRTTDEQAIEKLLIFQKSGLPNVEYLRTSAKKPQFIIAIGYYKSKINFLRVIPC